MCLYLVFAHQCNPNAYNSVRYNTDTQYTFAKLILKVSFAQGLETQVLVGDARG